MGFLRVGLDVLTSYVSQKTNKILCQLGNVVGEVSDTDNVEWWQHYGFASRPPKPTKGNAATQTVSIQEGNRTVVIASQDMRVLDIYGNIDHGEACLYSAGDDGKGQARAIAKKDGSINVYTTDTNTAEGRAVYFRVAPDGFSFVAPWGTLKFDETGFHVNHVSGAQIGAGAISGMPFPLDQIASYVRMQAGTLAVNASAQSFGGEAGHAPLANAETLEALLQLIVAGIAAIPTGGAAAALPSQTALAAAIASGTLRTSSSST